MVIITLWRQMNLNQAIHKNTHHLIDKESLINRLATGLEILQKGSDGPCKKRADRSQIHPLLPLRKMIAALKSMTLGTLMNRNLNRYLGK